jgi:hypothetical protein
MGRMGMGFQANTAGGPNLVDFSMSRPMRPIDSRPNRLSRRGPTCDKRTDSPTLRYFAAR